jgi:hypothetical protein
MKLYRSWIDVAWTRKCGGQHEAADVQVALSTHKDGDYIIFGMCMFRYCSSVSGLNCFWIHAVCMKCEPDNWQQYKNCDAEGSSREWSPGLQYSVAPLCCSASEQS